MISVSGIGLTLEGLRNKARLSGPPRHKTYSPGALASIAKACTPAANSACKRRLIVRCRSILLLPLKASETTLMRKCVQSVTVASVFAGFVANFDEGGG
jgi:hypothetical protein